MQIARVLGTVVSTRKEEEIEGVRLLLVPDIDLDLNVTGKLVVAADALNAGIGELVLYAQGSSARQTKLTHKRPLDATIMAIVDTFDIMGEVRYRKGEDDPI